MPDSNDDLPAVYTLRIGEKAADDIVVVRERFADLEGADIGSERRDSF